MNYHPQTAIIFQIALKSPLSLRVQRLFLWPNFTTFLYLLSPQIDSKITWFYLGQDETIINRLTMYKQSNGAQLTWWLVNLGVCFSQTLAPKFSWISGQRMKPLGQIS